MADTTIVRCADNQTRRCHHSNAGSSLVEQIIAIAIIGTVLLGLLGTLGASAKGIVTARQRTIAVSLAKQAIEHLQGSDYKNAVITGTGAPATFEGEAVYAPPGGTFPYITSISAAETTFTLKTLVTTVSASSRRITVIVDWPSSTPTKPHTMRFSSLVYDLDFKSYPTSSGSADATGGLVTLSGCLGGETFGEEDVRVALPGATADTGASTLRTSIGSAAGASSSLRAGARDDLSACVPGASTAISECPLTTIESIADNDSSTLTGSSAQVPGELPFACSAATPSSSVVIESPGSLLKSFAKTDSCSSCLWSTPPDSVPWAQATATTTSGSSGTFHSGSLDGSLWKFASGWSATALVDHTLVNHFPVDQGTVAASAQLTAPALTVLELPGFAGAVKVGSFTSVASAAAGDTSVAPSVTSPPVEVSLWNGIGYSVTSWTPGTPFDESASGSIEVGGRTVSFTSNVQSQPSAPGVVGAAPRTDAYASHPSLLVVTVAVVVEPTSAGPTGSSVPDTTVVPPPIATDSFTVVVDYGSVSARGTWLTKAA